MAADEDLGSRAAGKLHHWLALIQSATGSETEGKTKDSSSHSW